MNKDNRFTDDVLCICELSFSILGVAVSPDRSRGHHLQNQGNITGMKRYDLKH